MACCEICGCTIGFDCHCVNYNPEFNISDPVSFVMAQCKGGTGSITNTIENIDVEGVVVFVDYQFITVQYINPASNKKETRILHMNQLKKL